MNGSIVAFVQLVEGFFFPHLGFWIIAFMFFLFGLISGNTPIGIPVFGREHRNAIGLIGSLIIGGAAFFANRENLLDGPGPVIFAVSTLLGMMAIAHMNGYVHRNTETE